MKRLIATVLLTMTLLGSSVLQADAMVPTKTKPSTTCVTALNNAEAVLDMVREILVAQSEFFTNVSISANVAAGNPTMSGAITFVQSLTSHMQTLRLTVDDVSGRISKPSSAYRTNASACRAGK